MSSSFRTLTPLLTTRTTNSLFRSASSSASPRTERLLQAKLGYINSFHSIPNRTFTRNFQTTAIKMVVLNIANATEFSEALKNDVVVLDCFATWCGPCKVIAPQVSKFSEEFPNAHFIKVDVDEVPDVAQELGIRAMPTFIIFKNGEKIGEVVGANPPALKAAIQKAVA